MGARAPGVFFIELLLRSEPFFLLPSLEAFAFLGGVEESPVSAFSIKLHTSLNGMMLRNMCTWQR